MTRSRARRTHGTGGARRTPWRAVGLAAAVLVAVAGCGTEDGGGASPSPSPSEATTSPSPTESESPSPSPTAEPTTSFVYYLVDTGARAGIRLAREARDLAGEDPAREAVETMIEGPEDPDYVTTWNPDTEVLSVTDQGGTIDVDLSEEARTANVGSEGAERMIQQLVYTVTEAVDEQAAVRLLIEGEPAGELWGVVTWEEPVRRADPMDVRLFVQIDSPTEGEVTSSPLTVEGEANTFEANVPWRVLDDTGAEVEAGAAMAAEGMTFSPFSFTVELEPGTYTVQVLEDDPSGGEAPGEPMTDTRTVVVE